MRPTTSRPMRNNINTTDKDAIIRRRREVWKAHSAQDRAKIKAPQNTTAATNTPTDIDTLKHNAISKIQAIGRGFLARQQAQTLQTERNAAATKIQTLGRAFLAKQQAEALRNERQETAATKIQAGFRGMMARKNTREALAEARTAREEAIAKHERAIGAVRFIQDNMTVEELLEWKDTFFKNNGRLAKPPEKFAHEGYGMADFAAAAEAAFNQGIEPGATGSIADYPGYLAGIPMCEAFGVSNPFLTERGGSGSTFKADGDLIRGAGSNEHGAIKDGTGNAKEIAFKDSSADFHTASRIGSLIGITTCLSDLHGLFCEESHWKKAESGLRAGHKVLTFVGSNFGTMMNSDRASGGCTGAAAFVGLVLSCIDFGKSAYEYSEMSSVEDRLNFLKDFLTHENEKQNKDALQQGVDTLQTKHMQGMANAATGILSSGYTFGLCLYLTISAADSAAIASGLAASLSVGAMATAGVSLAVPIVGWAIAGIAVLVGAGIYAYSKYSRSQAKDRLRLKFERELRDQLALPRR